MQFVEDMPELLAPIGQDRPVEQDGRAHAGLPFHREQVVKQRRGIVAIDRLGEHELEVSELFEGGRYAAIKFPRSSTAACTWSRTGSNVAYTLRAFSWLNSSFSPRTVTVGSSPVRQDMVTATSASMFFPSIWSSEVSIALP